MDEQSQSASKDPLNTTTDGVIVTPPPADAAEEKTSHHHASFARRKSILPILFAILIMIVGLGVGLIFMQNSQDIRSKASNTGSTLALSPASKQATVEETFSVGATINTNDDTVAAAELHLTYDPTAIQILSFTPQTGLVVLTPETHTNGSIAVTLGVPPTNPFKGSEIIGTWTVKTLANKQSSIAFTSATQVAALGKSTNTLASATGSTITTGIVTATPALGVTPSPTPNPTPNIADLNNSGTVTVIDYVLFMEYWWLNNIEKGDLNGDGKISVIDYTGFMNAWDEYYKSQN